MNYEISISSINFRFVLHINVFGVYVYKSSVDGVSKYEVKLSEGDVLYSIYFDSAMEFEECEGERGLKP